MGLVCIQNESLLVYSKSQNVSASYCLPFQHSGGKNQPVGGFRPPPGLFLRKSEKFSPHSLWYISPHLEYLNLLLVTSSKWRKYPCQNCIWLHGPIKRKAHARNDKRLEAFNATKYFWSCRKFKIYFFCQNQIFTPTFYNCTFSQNLKMEWLFRTQYIMSDEIKPFINLLFDNSHLLLSARLSPDKAVSIVRYYAFYPVALLVIRIFM